MNLLWKNDSISLNPDLQKQWYNFVEEMLFLWRSAETLTGIRDCLRSCIIHWNLNSIQDLTRSNLKKYLMDRATKRQWSWETYNSNIRKLWSFFRYLTDEWIIKTNPVEGIRNKKVQLKNQYTMTKADCMAILWYLSNHKNTLVWLRNAVFFKVLMQTGCRKVEALGVMIDDVDLKNRAIRINWAKWAKKRVISFDLNLYQSLIAYLEYRKKIWRLEHFLFISSSKKWKAWTKAWARKTVDRIQRELGIKIQTHAFRRMVATELVKANEPIEKIALYLWHANTKTTMRYVDMVNREVNKNASEKMHAIFNSMDLNQ